MLLFNCTSLSLDLFATVASVVIAASAIFQFTYLVFIQAKKEKKRNEREWFHSLVIGPKINEVYNFFEEIERKIKDMESLLTSGFTDQKALTIANEFKTSVFSFRKSFVDLLNAIDSNLARKIQSSVDNFLDFYTEKLFNESPNEKDLIEIQNRFYLVHYFFHY